MHFYFHRESWVGIGIFHSLFHKRIAHLPILQMMMMMMMMVLKVIFLSNILDESSSLRLNTMHTIYSQE